MLQESRASSNDHLKSTRGSFFSRAVGRDIPPSWGNRIVKDFNDLNYDFTIDRFSNSSKLNQPALPPQERIKVDLFKRNHLSKRKVNPELDKSSSKKKKGGKREKMSLSLHLPERIEFSTLDTTASKHTGLCPFQYAKTIQGSIQKRSSHHLNFSKDKVQRIINQNPIYYDRHTDLDFSHSQTITQRQQLQHYHPFNSYLDRRVFQPRDELDKFFDTDQARKVASPLKHQQAVRCFQRVLPRQEQKLPESTGLAYEIRGCIERLKPKGENYSIQMTARETILGREVIDPKRGCRR